MARNLKTQNTLNKLKKKSPYASLTDVVNDLNVLGTELDSSVKVTTSAQGIVFDDATAAGIKKAVGIGAFADSFKAVAFGGDGYMYIRYAWSSTVDAVLRIRLYSSDLTVNAPVDWYGVRTIAKATADSGIVAAFAGGAQLAAQGDSIGPLKYNGTYIGANHGAFICHKCTAVAHGKTSADVGSEWSGPSSRKFYLLRVVDSDNLWVVSDSTGTLPAWDALTTFYTTSLASQTLTHSFGATNTASIAVSAEAADKQLTPALSRRSLSVVVDGSPVAYASATVVYPKTLTISEKYEVVSPAYAIEWVKTRAGQTPSFFDDAIQTDIIVENTHFFSSNGACSTKQKITWNNPVALGYVGLVQDTPPYFSGKALLAYIPGVNPIVGTGTWDFKSTVDFSGAVEVLLAPAASWIDATNPPNLIAQVVADTAGGTKRYGLVVGFSSLRGLTTRAKRSQTANNAGGFLSSATKKMYPYAITGTTFTPAAGSVTECTGYHHVYNIDTAAPDTTINTWYIDGPDVVVRVDFHKTSAMTKIALPAFAEGWVARVVDAQNVSVLSPVVDNRELAVSCGSTYGYAVIRLSAI